MDDALSVESWQTPQRKMACWYVVNDLASRIFHLCPVGLFTIIITTQLT